MYENVSSLVVFSFAIVNCLVFFLRERRFSVAQREANLVVDPGRTYFLWDPRGQPRRWVSTWILGVFTVIHIPLAFVVAALLVNVYVMISAYPLIIAFVGLVMVVGMSDYGLLGFANDFVKNRPTAVGEGDLEVLGRTRKALQKSVWLSLAVGLVFLSLASVTTWVSMGYHYTPHWMPSPIP